MGVTVAKLWPLLNFCNFLWKFVIKPGARRLHTWFLRIALAMNVGMCVCVRVSAPRLLITSGMMWFI